MNIEETKRFNFNGHQVAAIGDNEGEPWFVAKDVCRVLGLNNVTNALRTLNDKEKNSFTICNGNRGTGKRLIINESGLYSLILRSQKSEAWLPQALGPDINR